MRWRSLDQLGSLLSPGRHGRCPEGDGRRTSSMFEDLETAGGKQREGPFLATGCPKEWRQGDFSVQRCFELLICKFWGVYNATRDLIIRSVVVKVQSPSHNLSTIHHREEGGV